MPLSMGEHRGRMNKQAGFSGKGSVTEDTHNQEQTRRQRDAQLTKATSTAAALQEWRQQAVKVVLLVVVIVALPSYIFTILNEVRAGRSSLLLWLYLGVYLAIVGLAFLPRLDFKVKAWLFILVAYMNAAASLARLGLAGSGRVYLVAMPVIAALIISPEAGLISAAVSLGLYTAFALLAHYGVLQGWISLLENPLDLPFWVEAGLALAVFLILVIVLLERFYRLQVRALETSQRAVSEMEHTALELRQSEERFALVMQGTNDGLWDWNILTNDVYFSPRWTSMLGYGPDELPQRFETWQELVHPEDLPRALAAIQEHLTGRKPLFSLEHRLRHKDGSYRWILARGVSLRNAQDEPYRMAGSHTDITDRRQAEEALRASEAELRALFASMTDVILQLDANGRYLKIAPTNPGLLFKPAPDLLGKTLHQVFPKEQADYFLENIHQALRRDQPVEFEYPLLIEGKQTWFIATVSPMLEDTVVWVARDVTGIRQAQDALRESENNMRSLLESARHFAVYRIKVDPVDPMQANVIVASPSLIEMLEIGDPYDFSSWFSNIHPEDLPHVLEANRRSSETAVPFDERARFFSKRRNEWRWMHIRSTPSFDERGNVAYFNGLMVDITEQIRAEEELQVAYATLERRVEERTHELATLNAVAAVASRSLDLREVMTNTLDKIIQATNVEYGVAYRLGMVEQQDTLPGYLEAMASHGVEERLLSKISPLPLAGSWVQKGMEIGQPVVWRVADYYVAALREALQAQGVEMGISVPLVVKGRLVGAIILGTCCERPVSPDELSLLANVGQQAGMAVENARLYQVELERLAEAEKRRQVAEAMSEMLAAVNSTRSLPEILEHIVAQARRLLGSDAIAVYRLDETTRTLRIRASLGLPPEYQERMSIPLGKGAVGLAVISRQPVVVTDPHTTLPALLAATSDPLLREQLLHMADQFPVRVNVPLSLKDEIYGGLTLYYQVAREINPEELQLATTFANQAALAIENAQLREQTERSATLAERGRLARELHDSVTQSLYSVTLYAEAAARLLEGGQTAEAVSHLRELKDTAQEALREMRLLIYQLRPPELEKSGLVSAIQTRLDSVERRSGMQVEMQVEGVDNLPHPVQEELYHITQEALNNVLKHAHASRVWVSLQFLEEQACLEVRDDGLGFDHRQASSSGGLGLAGMAERVHRVGGDLEVHSAPGEGTCIQVTVPLSELA